MHCIEMAWGANTYTSTTTQKSLVFPIFHFILWLFFLNHFGKFNVKHNILNVCVCVRVCVWIAKSKRILSILSIYDHLVLYQSSWISIFPFFEVFKTIVLHSFCTMQSKMYTFNLNVKFVLRTNSKSIYSLIHAVFPYANGDDGGCSPGKTERLQFCNHIEKIYVFIIEHSDFVLPLVDGIRKKKTHTQKVEWVRAFR